MTHGDSIERLGDKLKVSATSKHTSIVAGVFNEEDKVYGVQFHPEVDLTPNGKQMLSNFLFDVCGLGKLFTISNRKWDCIKYIRESVGEKKVLLLASGGVDSTVCALLLNQALPASQIITVHIDNGEFNRIRGSQLESGK